MYFFASIQLTKMWDDPQLQIFSRKILFDLQNTFFIT